MKYKPLPPAEDLRAAFAYDPETGVLTRISTGVMACRKSCVEGYREISFKGLIYAAHRVIWCIVSGEDPKDLQIDHIDGVPSNNSWSNLRLATGNQNAHNAIRNRGSSGIPGVVWESRINRWIVRIGVGGKTVKRGSFKNAHDAEEVSKSLRSDLHGDYACHTRSTPFSTVLVGYRQQIAELVSILRRRDATKARLRNQAVLCGCEVTEALLDEAAAAVGIEWHPSLKAWRVRIRRGDERKSFGIHRSLRSACDAAFIAHHFHP